MLSKYLRGSEWGKWDLHFHTPSSYDYHDKSVKNEELIKVLKDNQISVVAITDHEIIDIDRIRELKRIAGLDITILPGIELCSNSRGADPIHFVGLFSETANLEYVWGELKSKSSIASQQTTGKKPEEIYCDLKTTSKLITNLGGIVSIHAGRKSNSIENITNSLPVTMAEKEDIARNIQIFELGQDRDQVDYKEKVFPKIGTYPMVICSDNHNSKKYALKQNCWIKANSTFEGLKQIIFDPDERVRIQELKPEDKPPYHIVDKVEFENNNGQKEIVWFNQNLNSIIGSRASGKSNLLKNIAFAIDYNQCRIKNIEESNFLSLKNFKVFWKDESKNSLDKGESKEKGILFIPQGYLGRLLDKEKQFDSFLADLFGNKEDFKNSLENYRKFENQNVLEVTSLIRELLYVIVSKKQKQDEAIKLGKTSDLREEINRIEKNVEEVNKSGGSITQEELEEYKNLNTQNNNRNLELEKAIKNHNSFEQLKKVDVITTQKILDFDFSEEYIKTMLEKIKESDKEFKSEFIDKELIKLKQLEISIKLEIETIGRKIKPLKDKLEKHKALLDLTKSLQDKKIILQRITSLIKDTESLTSDLKIKIDEIINKYMLFSVQYKTLDVKINNLEFSKFTIITDFDENNFKSFLEENVNFWNSLNFKEAKQNLYKDANRFLQKPEKWSYEAKDFVEIFKQLLDGILSDTLLLKSGKDKESVLKDLFKNRFKINFAKSITNRHGEDFNNMSDGEKMIALLEFIFEFDDYNYPVLLDQPEDDLDVRAISKNVVDFIKKQKRKRQIIVVSHNANLVVCGDSEEVIVANKSKGINPNFNYSSGAIENQELRGHIIEILEGGEEALRKRKNKLGIKN